MNDLSEESLFADGQATRAEVANMLYEMLDDLYWRVLIYIDIVDIEEGFFGLWQLIRE